MDRPAAPAALIRRFLLADAAPTHDVFVQAVTVGAASRYSAEERADWLPDPLMPPDWGYWLADHHTLVADEGDRITGFFMVEASGYLNMAFVTPDRMGTGLADRLLAGVMDHARDRGMAELTTLASRHARSFFARHGWTPAPWITEIPGADAAETAAALRLTVAMRRVLP
jgi:putative acetyltransferase